MASIVEMANQALLMLGENTIISMTTDSEAARLCNGRFAYVRDATLRAYPWNCALVRASLARSATAPTWGYDYQYALPTDPYCLRVLKMKEHEKDYGGYEWKVSGRYIETDATTCTIQYIKQVIDPNEMDILLREAISARLAAEICFPLTGSKTMQELMWAAYEKKIREAKSTDAQEGTPEEYTEDTFVDARY